MTVDELRATQNTPAVATYWLISGGPEPGGVYVLDPAVLGRSLPVFGFREEAELFLRLGGHEGDGRHARECGAGELLCVLDGPCADVKSVALDPLPGMAAHGTLGQVSVGRERFLARLLDGGSKPRHKPRDL